jgi:DNA ligase-1
MITEKNMMHGLDYLGEDVAGWLISEKLDGCRAYWDGLIMWTRGGKVIAIPDAMRAALPVGVHLDGEIHAGRDGFERARRAVQYGQWVDGIEFSAFDAPQIPGTFVDRYTWLEENMPFEGVVNYIQHDVCTGIDDALSFMEDIQESYGGEGVVLRNPANLYRPGRTDQILKLKRHPL